MVRAVGIIAIDIGVAVVIGVVAADFSRRGTAGIADRIARAVEILAIDIGVAVVIDVVTADFRRRIAAGAQVFGDFVVVKGECAVNRR
jgi:hypothetical protein